MWSGHKNKCVVTLGKRIKKRNQMKNLRCVSTSSSEAACFAVLKDVQILHVLFVSMVRLEHSYQVPKYLYNNNVALFLCQTKYIKNEMSICPNDTQKNPTERKI